MKKNYIIVLTAIAMGCISISCAKGKRVDISRISDPQYLGQRIEKLSNEIQSVQGKIGEIKSESDKQIVDLHKDLHDLMNQAILLSTAVADVLKEGNATEEE